MYDFTKYPIKKKTYSGANGNKISILINDELYMLKMPQHANKNENLSYSNSAISEYIGSHIKEYFDKNIKPIKNFGDLFCFFIRKEISLVV